MIDADRVVFTARDSDIQTIRHVLAELDPRFITVKQAILAALAAYECGVTFRLFSGCSCVTCEFAYDFDH